MSTRKKPINKTISKTISKRKTRRINKDNDNVDSGTSINFYNLRYSGTKLLPRTSILVYIYKNHYEYIKLKESRDKENKQPFTLGDFFKIGNVFDNIGTSKEINIDTSLQGKTSLYKFIADSVYSTQLSFFEPNNNIKSIVDYINRFKYQVGKDLPRNNVKLNGQQINGEELAEMDNYYLRTDKYVNLLLEKYHKIYKKINYNKINIILTVTTQNILNAMVNVIILDLTSRFSKDFNILFIGSNLGLDIEISPWREQAIWSFSSNMLISNIGEINPEFPCGKIEYKLLIDIKNKTFEFSDFKISYNLNTCETYNEQNEIVNTSGSSTEEGRLRKFLNNNKESLIYGIPPAIAAAGIFSTPFILGILGGNKKKYRRTKKNTRLLYKRK
jgi:hypothetical protein